MQKHSKIFILPICRTILFCPFPFQNHYFFLGIKIFIFKINKLINPLSEIGCGQCDRKFGWRFEIMFHGLCHLVDKDGNARNKICPECDTPFKVGQGKYTGEGDYFIFIKRNFRITGGNLLFSNSSIHLKLI